MKFCNLTQKLCPYVKDNESYRDLKDKVACNLAAMTGEKVYIISQMEKCPKEA